MPQSPMSIQLVPAEWVLIELLLDYRASLPYDCAQDLQIRFVGKHIRYRVLGQNQNELEVSVNKCPIRFRSGLKALYFKDQDKYTKRAEGLGVVPKFGILKCPVRSEIPPYTVVAQVSIFGLDICFTDTRTAAEFYRVDSTPGAGGTPAYAQIDALSRDTTIDALAYNVISHKIEDPTGRGLRDLKNGIIRVPVLKHVVLNRSSLCILRLIREACTTGFRMTNKMLASMKNTSVMMDVINGYAKGDFTLDDVRAEVMKIIRGADPGRGLSLIHMSLLYALIFVFPRISGQTQRIHPDRMAYDFEIWKCASSFVYSTVDCLLTDPTHRESNVGKLLWIDTESLWMLAVFSHLGHPRTNSATVIRDKGIVEAVANEAEVVHPETAISDLLRDSLNNMDDIHSYVEEPDLSRLKRSDIGLALRCWGITWRCQVLYAMLADIAHIAFDKESTAEVLLRYNKFLGHIFDNKLEYALFLDPILSRRDIEAIFGLKKRTYANALIYEAVVGWQIDNPHGSREAVIAWARHMIPKAKSPATVKIRDRTNPTPVTLRYQDENDTELPPAKRRKILKKNTLTNEWSMGQTGIEPVTF